MTAPDPRVADLLLSGAAIDRAAGAIYAECYPGGTFKGVPKYMRAIYIDQARAALTPAVRTTNAPN